MPELAEFTEYACGQLQRYGRIATPELAALLDAVVELNDNTWNARSKSILLEDLSNAIAACEKIRTAIEAGE